MGTNTSTSMTAVAILGCGYIGLALGSELRSRGHEVVGMRRSASGVAAVEDAGLTPVQGDVTVRADLEAIPVVDVAVFAASSGGGGAPAARRVYVEGLRSAIDVFARRTDPPDRLVYTSSTGVYGDHGGDWVDEDSPLRPATEKTAVLVEAEEAVREARTRGIDPVVARLGGIYGPERYRIARYLEGAITPGYLNQVHRADAVGALRLLVELDRTRLPETLLLVDDEPAWKPDLAAWLAEQCGRDPPAIRSRDGDTADESERGRRRRGQKRCSNDRLRELGYEFEYPTYREGYAGVLPEECP